MKWECVLVHLDLFFIQQTLLLKIEREQKKAISFYFLNSITKTRTNKVNNNNAEDDDKTIVIYSINFRIVSKREQKK